jgi:hypothetical protein
MQCNDMSSFSFSVGERELMKRFVVTWYLVVDQQFGIGAKFAQAEKTPKHSSTK